MEQNNNMKLSISVFIILRFIAIFVVLQIINLIPTWISTIVTIVWSGNHFSIGIIAILIGIVLVSILIPMLIWLYAKKIARIIIGKNNSHVEFVTAQIQLKQIVSLILIIISVILIIQTLPVFSVWLLQTLIAIGKSTKFYEVARPSWWIAIPMILKILLSIFLIIKVKFVTNLIYKVVNK